MGPVTTPADVDALVERFAEAADAYIRGDIHRYVDLFDHAVDFTLMPPYGGPTSFGYVLTEEGAAETSAFFRSGECRFELHESYASGDLVVLVGVEHQYGEVGGLPDQDWSLRVTLVVRRRGDRWEMAHRHADPLVDEIPFADFAVLAQGA
jgi:ketosteroid isomerase-like protein